jgi:hypothetical protein
MRYDLESILIINQNLKMFLKTHFLALALSETIMSWSRDTKVESSYKYFYLHTIMAKTFFKTIIFKTHSSKMKIMQFSKWFWKCLNDYFERSKIVWNICHDIVICTKLDSISKIQNFIIILFKNLLK